MAGALGRGTCSHFLPQLLLGMDLLCGDRDRREVAGTITGPSWTPSPARAAGAAGARGTSRVVLLIPGSTGVQQAPGSLTAPAPDDTDDAVDQWPCMLLEQRLQPLDQDLCSWAMHAQAVQDAALCTLYQPPLVPVYTHQPLVQPGLHRVQEMLLLAKKSSPHLRQEATHSHWAKGAISSQATGSCPCLAAGL